MAIFEGKEISLVEDIMPDTKWGKEEFFTDWVSQAKERNSYINDEDIEIARKTAIGHFYEIYEELLGMLENENLPDEEKRDLIRRINSAMTNVLEFAQRRNSDIILSLRDRKLQTDQKHCQIFNDFIDILIDEFKRGAKMFSEAEKEHYEKKDAIKKQPV
ncbi:MAG: hypothetical protein WC473_00270 [Patescibacteria group bacterium]|jgi:hypothetical protein